MARTKKIKDPNEKPETKRQKFERLISARMTKALKAIENVGKLANKSSYEFGSGDVAKIEAGLETLCNDVSKAFDHALTSPAKVVSEKQVWKL